MVQLSQQSSDKGEGKVRRLPLYILFTLAFVVYVFALASMSHEGFPADMESGQFFPYLADKPVGEDGYYMLTVAWNIASGRGLVYNFDMPTTGIQPLATAIYAMIAWLVQLCGGDKWLFVRSVLVFGSIALVLFGHIVGTIARCLSGPKAQDLGYILGFVGVVFSFALFRWFTYGLETGIYLILLALCILYSLRLPGTSGFGMREAIVLGLLGGATAWARIDFGIVFLVFLFLSVLRHQIKVPWAAATAAITGLVISPWFLYNYEVMNKWLPSSGAAQAELATVQDIPTRLWTMGKAVLSHLTPWVYSNAGGIFLLMAGLSLVAFLVFLFRPKAISSHLSAAFKRQPLVASWLCATVVLCLTYVMFFWAGHFYQRYSAPLIVPVTAIMAVAAAERIRVMQKPAQAILLSAMPLCFFSWAFLSLHTGRIGNSHVVSAGFVQSNYGSARVGAFQSGVVGYFNSNVINLDGKVNQDALDFAERGQLHLYVDAQQIDLLVDWRDYIYGSLDDDWLTANWEPCSVQISNGASICLRRRAP